MKFIFTNYKIPLPDTMKKILLIFCLLIIGIKGYSQQFSQYNTGTLYDSFENPSQRSFIPDSSRMYAFNFFIPNISSNFLLTGDAQSTLIRRAFNGTYNNNSLIIGGGKYNYVNLNADAYSLMFKIFTNIKGYQEVGFFTETRLEGKGAFTDESAALLAGVSSFPSNTYDNVLNNHYYYQLYDAIGASYREQINKQLAIGFKFSALMGIGYNKLTIDESHLNINKVSNSATISLRGRYFNSQEPGGFNSSSLLPTLRSPGAQISMGMAYKTDDHITFQGNIKDLGFIHWYSSSTSSSFNNTVSTTNLQPKVAGDSLANVIRKITNTSAKIGSFTTYTNARLEVSATKSYYLDGDNHIKYSPTLVVSKELFYNGLAGAFVNHFQYQNYHISVTSSYDNFNLFNVGLQFMIKSPNVEFFIGSERITQTAGFARAIHSPTTYSNTSYAGGNFFLGFALKFGQVVEHPLNASTIPNGDKGFFGRLWNRFFKTYQ